MKVLRIVSNLTAPDPAAAKVFYEKVFGLEVLMDLGFIVTLGNGQTMSLQVSFASEGGSGTPVPALSIEVDDLDTALARARALGASIAYGPTDEPWGVRRFFVRDPLGNLVNVLRHA